MDNLKANIKLFKDVKHLDYVGAAQQDIFIDNNKALPNGGAYSNSWYFFNFHKAISFAASGVDP